ncbi:potassium channel family protein [Nocardia mexicana]|uniref:Ion channel n=1 Tax=Nocardia mexicana TaxID=279262 RepID=A0A370H1F0_9NOCA|nr:potassium channel family protein [Nocardia mexicana]RDI49677.1 ion channel [Nocardia mexicana]
MSEPQQSRSETQRNSPEPPDRRPLRRALLRPLGTTTVLVTAYFVLPLRHISGFSAILLVAIGGVVVAVVCAWQIRKVLRAEYPFAQAVEALAATFGCYLVGYAVAYFLLAEQPDTFNAPLTRLDALYFCVTVFTTVGFGDIVATAQSSRAIVLTQMIGNLILLGLAVRLLTASVHIRRGQLRDRAATGDR